LLTGHTSVINCKIDPTFVTCKKTSELRKRKTIGAANA